MSTQTAASTSTESELLVDRQKMPYELADEIGYRARIALIVLGSDRTIEHEFRKMLDIPGVAFYESRIQNDAEISPESNLKPVLPTYRKVNINTRVPQYLEFLSSDVLGRR